MPRTPAPIPPITPVPRDLTVDDVRTIIETAEHAQARRAELAAAMRAALAAGDQARVNGLAREMVGLEESE
jgi:hypothetical protein